MKKRDYPSIPDSLFEGQQENEQYHKRSLSNVLKQAAAKA